MNIHIFDILCKKLTNHEYQKIISLKNNSILLNISKLIIFCRKWFNILFFIKKKNNNLIHPLHILLGKYK